jgi:type III secretory pathway component EscU
MKIDKEKMQRMMQNKKFITIIGVLMLVLGVSLSYVATYLINSGYEYASSIISQCSQVFMLIFIGLFAYAIFALDKQLTKKLKERKEAIEQKIKGKEIKPEIKESQIAAMDSIDTKTVSNEI